MARVKIEDLTVERTLSGEEMTGVTGAGKKHHHVVLCAAMALLSLAKNVMIGIG